MTLIELVAAMAVLALAAALSAVALGVRWESGGDDVSGLRTVLREAKREAIITGRPVTVEWLGATPNTRHRSKMSFTAFPDGSVAGEPGLGIAFLTGALVDSAHGRAP